LLAEARRREADAARRIGGLPDSSAGPRRVLVEADAEARAALAEWDAQLRSGGRIVDDAIATGRGTAVVRALRAERERLDEARQATEASHLARQRALEVVMAEVTATRAAARGIAERSAAQQHAANRAAAEGGALRFAVRFRGDEIDASSSEDEMRRLLDLLYRCPELAVDLTAGAADVTAGRARAVRLRAALETRGVLPAKLTTLGGFVGDDVVVRVVRTCPPPPPPED
jgi:hypothetical protein